MSLIVGDKLSGQFGGFDIGAFSVLTDETPTGEDGQILSVARVTHPIFAESKFGFVVTNGDPTGLDREHGRGRRISSTAIRTFSATRCFKPTSIT